MTRRKKLLAAGVAAAVVAISGAGYAIAGGVGDDGDEQATGPGADRAREAALAITGGTANSVERDGENGATWEVEVTKPSGETVDVRLDESYGLVVIEGDSETENESGASGSEGE